jgi:hypothetical protein
MLFRFKTCALRLYKWEEKQIRITGKHFHRISQIQIRAQPERRFDFNAIGSSATQIKLEVCMVTKTKDRF